MRLNLHSNYSLRSAWLLMAAAVTALTFHVGDVTAQLPQIRLNSVFPAGGQVGTTFDITTASGIDLDEADSLYFNHPGIKAIQKTKEANGKKTPITNAFIVTIAGNVPPGIYEVRVGGLYGVSNPRSFAVNTRKEAAEVEPNNDLEKATAVELNTIVNARSNTGADIDFYKFQGKKGQRVIVSVRAARIDSRMIPVVGLYDASGRRLAYARNTVRNDAVLDFVPPADGEYSLKIHDFTYGGNNDYFYRLSVHTGPYIDYVMPPAGLPGTTAKFTLYGRNLPGGQPAGTTIDGSPLQKLDVQIALPADPTTLQFGENVTSVESGIDGTSYVLNSPAGPSNPITIFLATAPVALEKEPNNLPEQAQKISIPGEFAGQFQERGDIDYIAFEAKAKEVYWIEAFGHRMGTGVDPYMIIERVTKNAKGEESVSRVTVQDDVTTNLAPNIFDTTTDDPAFRFVVPADGTYRIAVRDRYFEARGNPRLTYRISIIKEQGDYRLIALPVAPTGTAPANPTTWAADLRRGDNLGITVMAFRRHGFTDPIDITAEGLPQGVTCTGATIGTASNSTTLVLSSNEQAKKWFGTIKIVGKARIKDKIKEKAVTDAKAAIKTAQAALPKIQQEAKKQTAALKAPADKLKAADAVVKKSTAGKTATTKVVTTTAAVLKKSQTDKAAADKAATAAATAVKTATDKATAAKKAADAKKDDKNLAAAKTAADKAAATATAAAKKAAAAKTAADKTLVAATAAAKKATAVLTATNKTLATVTAAAKTALGVKTKAEAAAKKATDALAAAQKKVVDATLALKTAEAAHQAAIRQVTRLARPATIAQNGVLNQKVPKARLARSLTLAVYEETAPFQLATNVTRIKANQNRQILIPIKLIKRAGFDNNVTLTFVGQPKNVQVANKPINKGKNEQILRVFIPNNAPLGTYTLYLKSQGQVSYSRNPQKAERLKADQAIAVKTAADAAAIAAQAVATRNAAVQKSTVAIAAVKKATTDKTAATKVVATTTAALKKTQTEKVAADKATAAAATAAKAATDKAAAAKKSADGKKDDKNLAAAKTAADKAVATATAAAKKATAVKTATDKKLVAATAATKKATAALAVVDKTLATATVAAKAALDAKTKAEAAVKATDAKSKAAAAAKTAVDKTVTAAVNAAKPKNLNFLPPSTPIVIEIKKAPATLAANVPGGGAVKRGAKIDIKVTVNRANGFAGPVNLSLPIPPYVKGITAAVVAVPADKKEGVLSIQVANNAVIAGDKTAADKKVKDAAAALKKATDEKTKAEKAATDAETKAKAATDKAVAATKAAAADTKNKGLQNAKAAAVKAVAATTTAVKTATTAKTAAAKKHSDAQAAVTKSVAEQSIIEFALSGYAERMVVRATMDFEGKAAVDVPIKLNVTK